MKRRGGPKPLSKEDLKKRRLARRDPKDSGRPVRQITKEQITVFLKHKHSLADTAAYFDTTHNAIEEYIRDRFGKTFLEFRNDCMVVTRNDLMKKALEKALDGDNTMLELCLINYCGWSRKMIAEFQDSEGNLMPIVQIFLPSNGRDKDVITIDEKDIKRVEHQPEGEENAE